MASDLPPGFVLENATTDLPPGFVLEGQDAALAASMTHAPAVAPQNQWSDAAKSLGAGIIRGAAETPMLPITMKRMAESGANWALGKGDAVVRAAFGLPPAEFPGVGEGVIDKAIYGAQDAARGAMNDVLYEPKTTVGRFAGTIGEFMAPGALPSKATRALAAGSERALSRLHDITSGAIIPGAVSETAGQLTEGTVAEPVARLAGALAGGVGVAGVKALNAPEFVTRQFVGNVTPEQWAEAKRLYGNPTGVRLSAPEAIAQATGGGSAVTDLLRVVEGSPYGKEALGPFFARRPGEVRQAVGGVLDQIAPQSATPTALGPQAARLAEKALADTPEGRALFQAIFDIGPMTTAEAAGSVIQPALRSVYERREGMRAALGDADFKAARNAEPSIPVADLVPEQTVRKPEYTTIKPVVEEGAEKGAPPTAMAAETVPAKIDYPGLTSRTGPEYIQADPRSVVQFIDDTIPNVRGATQDVLRRVRSSLFTDGGVDTSIRGMDAVRNQLNDLIEVSKRSGENSTAATLLSVRDRLDAAMSEVPEYAKARANYEAASRPLDPFTSPGMSGVVAKDATNTQFAMPPERVPEAVRAPSEAANFAGVAPPEARNALESYLSTDILRGAQNAGRVDADALARAIFANTDTLSRFPEVASRLGAVEAAARKADEAAQSSIVGQVARANTTDSAGAALLPFQPHVGGAAEIGDAVRQLAAQDPVATGQLLRQTLADRFASVAGETRGAGAESSGFKFFQNVAGEPAKREALVAALKGQGTSPAAMNALLEVLDATGKRQPIGARTAFNTLIHGDLSAGGAVARGLSAVRDTARSMFTSANDAVTRARLHGNTRSIAEMFIAPDALEQIQAASARGLKIAWPEALLRGMAQGSTQGNK